MSFPLFPTTGENPSTSGPIYSGAVIPAGTTTTQTAIQLPNAGATKLVLVVNVTAGAGTVTLAVSGMTASGYTYPILTSAALGNGTTTALTVAPGAAVTANVSANAVVPRYVVLTATVATGATYGVDYELSV